MRVPRVIVCWVVAHRNHVVFWFMFITIFAVNRTILNLIWLFCLFVWFGWLGRFWFTAVCCYFRTFSYIFFSVGFFLLFHTKSSNSSLRWALFCSNALIWVWQRLKCEISLIWSAHRAVYCSIAVYWQVRPISFAHITNIGNFKNKTEMDSK